MLQVGLGIKDLGALTNIPQERRARLAGEDRTVGLDAELRAFGRTVFKTSKRNTVKTQHDLEDLVPIPGKHDPACPAVLHDLPKAIDDIRSSEVRIERGGEIDDDANLPGAHINGEINDG